MAITGAHVLLYSAEPQKLREVLRDVFGWKHVDAGDGWLIFLLPPAELGVHPAEADAGAAPQHQFSLMCDDIHATIQDLRAKGVNVAGEPQDQGWGIVVDLVLPGEVTVMLYQAKHPVALEPDRR
jgi:predicted enzyme related to lactoylglutathione lyase